MGNGEQIRVGIESGLRNGQDPRQTRSGGQRSPKKVSPKPGQVDPVGGEPEERSLGEPLGRLMPALVEQGIDLLQGGGDEGRLELVGAVLRGLERFDVEDSRWDGAVATLFQDALAGLVRCPALPTADPAFVELTEAVVAGVATEMKVRLTGETPILLDRHEEAWLGQLLVVLLQHSGQAVSEAISLKASDRCYDLAQHLSASVCGFFLEHKDTTLAAVLARPPMLDRLVVGLWNVIAEFPGAFSEGATVAWWRDVLAELARPRRDESAYQADLVAEAVVLVVERGAADYTALVRNPSNKQLFLTTTMRGLLEVLTETIGEESKYRLVERLGRTELYLVMQAVVCAWIERPEWLFRKPAQQEKAATLLPVLVESLAELDEGSLKGLLRHERLQRVLVSALLSGLSSKLSSLNGRRIASVLNPVLVEFAAMGYAGWTMLLEQDRLTDLLSAISKSKIEDKLFSEDAEDVRAAGRSIALIAHELRTGRPVPLNEIVERLNKGK